MFSVTLSPIMQKPGAARIQEIFDSYAGQRDILNYINCSSQIICKIIYDHYNYHY